MAEKQKSVFCPIRGSGCNDLSCDGVLPVRTHEDSSEYDDGESRLRLVCFKGDAPYELPSSYTQEELNELAAKYEEQIPILSSNRHYPTRKAISVPRAAELAGLSQSTIKRLDKDPKNTKYPGRNVEEWILEAWGKNYHKGEKIAHREVRAANRPYRGTYRK